MSLAQILEVSGQMSLVSEYDGMESIVEMVEIDLKYAGYIDRENELIRKVDQMEGDATSARFGLLQDDQYHH